MCRGVGRWGHAELDEQRYWFITDNEGVKHLVYKDEGHKVRGR